jgi:hypothetical protein
MDGNANYVSLSDITIDGQKVRGKLQSISIFENIFTPIITGQVTMVDSDGNNFVEKEGIEGNETLEFEYKNANDETLEFKGHLNGIRDRHIDGSRILYVFDFTSDELRENENTQNNITGVIKNKNPEDIFNDMVQKLGGQVDKSVGKGLPLTFIPARWRPTQVMNYVNTHGVTVEGQNSVTDSEDPDSKEETSSGTTGFLFWQTLDGYRFASIDNLLSGEAGNDKGEFKLQLENRGLTIEESMKTILQYDFPLQGDTQAKMRSGALNHTHVVFDMDRGVYKEIHYDAEDLKTDKQKEIFTAPTRVTMSMFCNEAFEPTCEKAVPDSNDQTKLNKSQNIGRENTFDDTQGTFTFNPQFTMRPGDFFEAKISKVESEFEGGYDQKYSGRYIVKEMAHHIDNNGTCYTKVGVIRSTTQQDDATSRNK